LAPASSRGCEFSGGGGGGGGDDDATVACQSERIPPPARSLLHPNGPPARMQIGPWRGSAAATDRDARS